MKVTIEQKDNALRLRFNDGTRRRCISLGIPNSPAGKARASQIKAQIEMDWLTNNYDRSLLKYKPQKNGKNATDIKAAELFERFTAHQSKQESLAQSSIDARYKPLIRSLEQHLDLPASAIDKRQAEAFADYCGVTLSAETARARVWLLKSCWEWAVDKYKIAPVNPWNKLDKRFKVAPKQKVKPFTVTEMQHIIKVFSEHPKHRHYTEFVSFLANTACRPGEAVGLRWKSLAHDYSQVWLGESVTRGVRGSTKTNQARTIPLSPMLQAMLLARFQRMKPEPDDLVFPNFKGATIDDHYFRSRIWIPILKKCGIEYRKPYTLRHSAITHLLQSGANPNDVAKLAGHSLIVLLKVYDHAIPKSYLFLEV